MAPSRPQIRAFLSSTFSDFLEERSLLVKQVFPELRRKAKDRGVEVVEVDLRWGITEEQSKQGQTIGICLDEIERCRPYFIGLLGDRYGWVPEKEDYRPELLRRQAWLPQHQGNASVTELEILHGVLNNPEMAGRAFFYFRDPAYSDAKAAESPGWRSENSDERQKLEALKQRIRDSDFPVVEGLATPLAIAEQIEADLWSLIEEQYPEAVKTDALALEAGRHASYRADRTGLYLGGEVYITQLQDWISTGEQRILITGDSGAGKSALIANWVAAHESSQPDDVIFCHHLGSSNDASALRPLLARMIDSASTLLADELSEPLKVPQDWWELVTQVTNSLSRLSDWAIRHQRRWIWVLDGLDKLDLEDQQALPWLPLVLPKGVHLVASALDCQVRTLLQERQFTELTIGPLCEAEQEQLIKKYLSLYTKELVPALRQKITGHRQGSSPLFLRVLLEELRLCGKFETLAEQLKGYLAAESVADLYELVLQRLEDDGHGDAVRKVMTALWASRAGLSENELLEFTGLVNAQWAPIGIGLQEALSEGNGRLVFGHEYLRKAVEDRYLQGEEDRRHTHSDLADWLIGREGWDKREAEELPWQLQHAERYESLLTWLADPWNICILTSHRPISELISYENQLQTLTGIHLDDFISDSVAHEIATEKGRPEVLVPFLQQIRECLEEAGLFRSLYITISKELLSLTAQEDVHTMKATASTRDLARAFLNVGDHISAEQLFDQVLKTSKEYNQDVDCGTLSDIANLKTLQGKMKEAEEFCSRAVASAKEAYGERHPKTVAAMNNLGVFYSQNSRLQEALDTYTKALWIIRDLTGDESQEALALYHNLSSLHNRMQQYHQAADLGLRAYSGRRNILGSTHPLTLNSQASYATALQGQCDYGEARQLFSFIYEARRSLLGEEHTSTLTDRNNLALACSDQGEWELAKELYEFNLEIEERLYGESSPCTIISYKNLAALCLERGLYGEAERYFRSSLVACKEVYGNQHPYQMSNRIGLASSLSAQELYEEAIEQRRIELIWCREEKGDRDAGTLTSISALADDLSSSGDPDAAEPLYSECLAGRGETLGSDHPATMASRYDLANCMSSLGRYEEAIELRRVELAWCQSDPDWDTAEMLVSMHGLGSDLLVAGKQQEALDVLQECLSQRQILHGQTHDDTLSTVARVLEALSAQGRQRDAIALSQQAYQAIVESHDEAHPEAHTQLGNQASLHEELGELEQAEELYRRCLAGREEALGSDHSDTLSSIDDLAHVLSQQERHAEAIPLRRRELAWCREQHGDTDPDTLSSINQLAIDLRETGEFEEAESLFRELVAGRQQVLEPGDFDIGRALGGLAKILEAAGKLEEALEYAQHCLNHRLEYEGTDSFYTNRNRLDVARVLHKLARNSEALVLLSQLDASLNSESELSDDEEQLRSDASRLRSTIEGDPQ